MSQADQNDPVDTLKLGLKKKGANRRCDCDGYRPDILGGEFRGDLFLLHTLLHLQRGAVNSLAAP